MRFGGLICLALVAACQPEFFIDDVGRVKGANNPPALETPSKTDTIVQVTTPEVDVLWVIDDSCSMIEEQRLLRDNFANFMGFFLDSGLDWHIGVVSTDATTPARSGKLVQAGGYRYLDTTVADPVGLFGEMAVLGTNGSSDESGRRASFKALTEPLTTTTNAGFYRENATLNIVVISDEDDYSGSNPTRNEYIDWLLNLKAEDGAVTFSSIVGPTGGCANAVEVGTDYIVVTNAVGGIHESICTNDWAALLEDLGLQAAGLKREYFMSEVPVPGTIEVWVEDGDFTYGGIPQEVVDGGTSVEDACTYDDGCFVYSYDQFRNSIVMSNFVPSPLARVHVRYDLLSAYQPATGSAAADTDE
jgi:hypothetical protein